MLTVPALSPEGDSCGFPAVGSTQERLNIFISLRSTATHADIITKPYSIAVPMLRKNAALLARIRPHNYSETPFLPFPIFFASSLEEAVRTHGIYLLLVYRIWYLSKHIISNEEVSTHMRLTATDWRSAHALLALYITTQYPPGTVSAADDFAKIGDRTITTVCTGLFDAPADKYAPGPATTMNAGNSLPDLSKELLSHFLALCPGTKHPFYDAPKKSAVSTPAAAFVVLASKLVPGRCLRRGGKDLILLWWGTCTTSSVLPSAWCV